LNALQKLSDATRMLAEVRDAKEAKQMMDLAASAEHYARKAKLGQEAIDYAHGIKIDAQVMLGKFLKTDIKHDGARGVGTDQVPTLPEGISKKESAASQFLATIAEQHPEEIQKIRIGEKTLTQVQREQRRSEALQQVEALPTDKFRVIYADPPWKYGDTLAGTISENYGGAEKHYPPMTISELSVLPIRDLAHDDAVLFLWVTSPLLFECEPVFKAWGFSYKSAFIWDKVRHNMGHYNSVRHELLLICTRGSCLPDVPQLFDSVQSIERTSTHSEKPEEFRSIIDTLYPHGERLELFARAEVSAPWKAWGSEVTASA